MLIEVVLRVDRDVVLEDVERVFGFLVSASVFRTLDDDICSARAERCQLSQSRLLTGQSRDTYKLLDLRVRARIRHLASSFVRQARRELVCSRNLRRKGRATVSTREDLPRKTSSVLTSFGESFRDDKLREIDLVCQEV